MSQTKECEPFIIHTVLLPSPESSFIHKLILAYSQKLSEENPQFQIQFQEKQDKLSRHNDQLKLLSEMKEDQILREQVLQQIELKDYEKEYRALFGPDQINEPYKRPLSYKFKPSNKQNRSFHMGSPDSKSKENLTVNCKPQEKFILGPEQHSRKFRSSLVKSGSFSSIKKKNKGFSEDISNHKSLRNSSDQGFLGDGKIKNEPMLKKKGLSSLQSNECEKSFVRSKDIIKNSIMQNYEEQEQEKSRNVEDVSDAMKKFREENCFKQRNENEEEDRATQRTHLKTPSSKLPEVCCAKQMTPGKHKPKDQKKSMNKSANKYYLKDNKQNPYHISHFLRQLNTCQYLSQYNHAKNQTKRNGKKSECL